MVINLLVVFFTIFGIRKILFSKNGHDESLKWIIFAFILGYRTFEPFPGLKLHPIEIFVYAGILRIMITNIPKYSRIPVNISVLSFFFFSFFIIDCLTRYNQNILLEFKNAILLLLIFFVVQHIQIRKVYIIKLLKIYLFSASTISILGIMEFIFPSFMSSLFGYQIEFQSINNNLFFNRVAFLFWGSHLAANLIPPVFPILLLLKTEKDHIVKNNIFLTFLIIVNLFSIYLSGNRISWLILTIFLVMMIFQFKSSLVPYMKTYTVLVTVTFVVYIYSQPVEGRYVSTFRAFTGQIDTRYDSSGNVRIKMAKNAINSVVSYPLGTGWANQGWVHSDVLQVAASVGIIPGVIFLIAPLILLLRIYRDFLTAHREKQPLFFTFGCLLIFIIISLSLNGNFFLVQCGVPLFLFWALIDSSIRNKNILDHSYLP